MHTRVHAYLSELAPTCSPHTHRQYARHLTDLAEWHGKQRPVPAITPVGLQAFVDQPTVRTGAQRCSATRGFLRWLPEFTGDPDALRPPRPTGRALPDLGEAEIDTVLIAIGDGSPRERALVLVLLHCGLRADEAAALTWADVGLRWLRVGDAARTRQVPLPRATGEALQALARERLGEPVFADSRGRSISTRALYNIVAAAGERADVEGLNPRALRRACLNRHRRARRTLDQIAARMGYQCTLVVRRALGELAAELVPCTGCPGLPDLSSAHVRCGVCQGTGVTVEVPPAYADRVLPSTALGRLSGRRRRHTPDPARRMHGSLGARAGPSPGATSVPSRSCRWSRPLARGPR